MSDYTRINDYAAKDALSPGDASKVIRGSEQNAELNAIATAIATKIDKPSSPAEGEVLTYVSGAWTASASSSIPVGTVIPWAGSGTVPSGWADCDGNNLSTSTYSSLFAVIGYTYGGSGASFAKPDIRGRVVAGQGTSTRLTSTYGPDESVLGSVGGSQTSTLSNSNLPNHNHSFSGTASGTTGSNGAHTHTVSAQGPQNGTSGGSTYNFLDPSGSNLTTSQAGSHTHSASLNFSGSTDYSGAGNPLSNVQPTMILRYIIKL